MELSRRQVLKRGAGLLALGVFYEILNKFQTTATGFQAISARQYPNGRARMIGDPPPERDFLNDRELQAIYNHNLATLVDKEDEEPIIGFPTFKDQMYWIHRITSVLHNQMDSRTRPNYVEFTSRFIEQSCTLSRFVDLHPAVFLETYLFSGQDVGGIANQREDVKISQLQFLMNTALQLGEGIGGATVTEFIQQALSDPYNDVFTPGGRKELQEWVDRLGLNIKIDRSLRPMSPNDAVRLLNTTIGMMDIEPIVYALGYQFIKDHYPKVAEFAFVSYPQATSRMTDLVKAKHALDITREDLKKAASEFLRHNPHTLDDFFDANSASRAFTTIGIGKRVFSYTRDFYTGVQWDEDHFDQATGGNFYAPPIPQDQYYKERGEFILDAITEYWLDQYRKSPQEAELALLADQIFNPTFIDFLQRKIGNRPVLQLRVPLNSFDVAATNMREARLNSYPTLGQLEYDWKFQAAISVATTRFLLDEVQQEFTDLRGETRNQLYWQMYLISFIRDIAPYPSLLGQFLRSDVDELINNRVLLRSFRDYYNSYVNTALILPQALPEAFSDFTKMEWRYRRGRFPKEYPDQDINPHKMAVIDNAARKFLGSKIYSGWQRAITVGPSLGIDIDYPPI